MLLPAFLTKQYIGKTTDCLLNCLLLFHNQEHIEAKDHTYFASQGTGPPHRRYRKEIYQLTGLTEGKQKQRKCKNHGS